MNKDLMLIGRNWFNVITVIAVSSWLAVITSTSSINHLIPLLNFNQKVIIATVVTYLAVRKAIELAKTPPPVLPEHAEAPVMRWLNRNEMSTEHNRHYP
jgi:TRAP-type uncharacterized transport system fused permease subunit